MRAKVICFASAKGGTGKTTCSASFATFLDGLGKKILLIDMDAATNGLSLLYLEELVQEKMRMGKDGTPTKGIFEVINSELPSYFRIHKTMDFIPATYVMKQTDGVPKDEFRITVSTTINAFREKYDYIILDAQAGSDIFSQIAFESADEIVIVSEYDPISAEGVDRLRRLFPEALPYDKTWILLDKVLPEFAKSLGEFLSVARYLSPIPWDAEVVRALSRRRLAIDMEKGNAYTLAIMQTIDSLLGREIEEEINRWKRDKDETIKEPIRKQLEKLENEMTFIQKAIINTEYTLEDLKNKPRKMMWEYFTLLLFTMAVAISLIYIYGLPSTILGMAMAIFVMFFALIVYYINGFEKRFRKDEKILRGQLQELNSNFDDLKELRHKYKTLVEYNFETYIKKSES